MAGEPSKGGRPRIYTPELVSAICDLIASGLSMREACREHELEPSTFIKWSMSPFEHHEAVFQQYMQACQVRREHRYDEIMDIADDGSNDWMERHDKDGKMIGWRENGEATRRSAIRIAARQWELERMDPKRFGSKKAVEHTGDMTVRTKRIILQDGPE